MGSSQFKAAMIQALPFEAIIEVNQNLDDTTRNASIEVPSAMLLNCNIIFF